MIELFTNVCWCLLAVLLVVGTPAAIVCAILDPAKNHSGTPNGGE